MEIEPNEEVHSLETQTLSREQIMADYKDVFEGPGHIGDTAIITDPLVKPTQHSPSWVPIALRYKVKEKLENLEIKGIVEKVTIQTESSMVVVSMPSKTRICLDLQNLNKAFICPKYQMPTLEELPKLTKAKVCTTLDAKNGFYQVGLDEQSSLNTTFWTPFGRYKYLNFSYLLEFI